MTATVSLASAATAPVSYVLDGGPSTALPSSDQVVVTGHGEHTLTVTNTNGDEATSSFDIDTLGPRFSSATTPAISVNGWAPGAAKRFAFVASGKQPFEVYELNVKRLDPGPHTLRVTVVGDPTTHSLSFTVKGRASAPSATVVVPDRQEAILPPNTAVGPPPGPPGPQVRGRLRPRQTPWLCRPTSGSRACWLTYPGWLSTG